MIPGVGPPGGFNVYPVWNKNAFYTYSVQADWNLGFGVLTVLPTYNVTGQQQTGAGLFAPAGPPPYDYGISTISTGQSTLEVRLASEESSAIKWVGGFYGLKANADQYGALPGASTATFYSQQSNNRRPSSSYAGFAQATYPITSALRATAGARYTVDEKSVFYGVCSSNPAIYPDCGPSETGAGTYLSPAADITNRYSAFTYLADLDYDLTPTSMAYAKVATGYKAGGYSTAAFPPLAYSPERLTDFETGVKSRMLDNKLEVNADLYLYLYHDQQIELHVIEPYSDIIPIQYVPATWQTGGAEALANPATGIDDVNAGNSRFYGAEIQMQYQLTPHDLVSVQAAYEQATYGNFVIPIAAGSPPGATDGTATSYDLSGQREAHAPTWNGQIGYQHVWDLPQGTLTLRGTSRFQTWSYTTIQEWFADGNTIQPSYHKSDLHLRYQSPNDTFAAGLWVTNVVNKATVNYVYPLYREVLDAPRMYGGNVSFKF